jgi:hypothetical protein
MCNPGTKFSTISNLLQTNVIHIGEQCARNFNAVFKSLACRQLIHPLRIYVVTDLLHRELIEWIP